MCPFTPFSLNIRGRLISFGKPAVMGIINVTPDSFYAGSRVAADAAVGESARHMVASGADIIDVGAISTRSGADDVPEEEELRRLAGALRAVRDACPGIPLSVDTSRASVARRAVTEMGADIINDVAGGSDDPLMFQTVADLRVPYVLMHRRGTPRTMQAMTDYSADGSVTAAVAADLAAKMRTLRLMGVADVIVDPGFGFAKTLDQNYELLAQLPHLARLLQAPILVGVSRKSMIYKLLDIMPGEALCATTAVNTIALLGGASILRVHDPLAATQAVRIVDRLRNAVITSQSNT